MSNLLSLILFTPLVGAILLLFMSRRNEQGIRWIANIFTAVGFLVSVPLWFWYNPQDSSWQFVERGNFHAALLFGSRLSAKSRTQKTPSHTRALTNYV